MKNKFKIILTIVTTAILVGGLSVYATYNYMASDVKYIRNGEEISVESALNELYEEKNNTDKYTFVASICGGTENGTSFTTLKSNNAIVNDKVASNNNGVITLLKKGKISVSALSKSHSSTPKTSYIRLYHNSTLVYSQQANEIIRIDEFDVEAGDTIYAQIASGNTWGYGSISIVYVNE